MINTPCGSHHIKTVLYNRMIELENYLGFTYVHIIRKLCWRKSCNLKRSCMHSKHGNKHCIVFYRKHENCVQNIFIHQCRVGKTKIKAIPFFKFSNFYIPLRTQSPVWILIVTPTKLLLRCRFSQRKSNAFRACSCSGRKRIIQIIYIGQIAHGNKMGLNCSAVASNPFSLGIKIELS